MCQHKPHCPPAQAADREAAKPVANHPEQAGACCAPHPALRGHRRAPAGRQDDRTALCGGRPAHSCVGCDQDGGCPSRLPPPDPKFLLESASTPLTPELDRGRSSPSSTPRLTLATWPPGRRCWLSHPGSASATATASQRLASPSTTSRAPGHWTTTTPATFCASRRQTTSGHTWCARRSALVAVSLGPEPRLAPPCPAQPSPSTVSSPVGSP